MGKVESRYGLKIYEEKGHGFSIITVSKIIRIQSLEQIFFLQSLWSLKEMPIVKIK